ncbi:outer membrane protein assembly factor BamC [Nitrosomonas oligotropha]|uniref:outer membrane protein assembly factor BamC n=1 Tax=Nitrosomonas oligotropha TaxID=42354 RepID=UPI00136D9560|nr:outer membrane protein assembly factor BamC [Nitrosomonas oligotropha]MXS83511.1 outer membrane protein assembly factor BamC [Nitrosomonas oligotropha]
MSKMKWRKVTIPSLVLTLSLASTGCKMIDLFPETKTIDYKSAGKLPPLEIPPDLIQPAIDERYAIPEANSSGSTTFSSYNNERGGQQKTASSSLIPLSIQNVHIERAGTQRWLVIPQPPEAVWPVVKEFWQELGFLIKMEVPEAGIMETDWAENRAKIPQDIIRTFLSTFLDSIYSTAERDKFRTRLERNDTTTEVYISHRGMTEVLEGGSLNRTIWQPRPADPDLEAEMLSRLMMRFGVEEQKAKLELTTGRSSTSERAFINSEGTSLVVNEAFDRSWRRVGLALDRIGFTVEDRNREQGIYFVRYVSPDKDSKKKGDDEGILSNIMFWRSGDKDSAKAAKYRIQVHNTGTNISNVTLLNDDGTAVGSATASRILKLLHEQLK